MQSAKPIWNECSGSKYAWNNIILGETSPCSAVVCSYVSSGFAALSHGLKCQWCALWFHYGSVSFQIMAILVTHILYSSLRTRTVAWEPGDIGFRCSWRNYRLLFWITAKITVKTHSKFTWFHECQLSLASSCHLLSSVQNLAQYQVFLELGRGETCTTLKGTMGIYIIQVNKYPHTLEHDYADNLFSNWDSHTSLWFTTRNSHFLRDLKCFSLHFQKWKPFDSCCFQHWTVDSYLPILCKCRALKGDHCNSTIRRCCWLLENS